MYERVAMEEEEVEFFNHMSLLQSYDQLQLAGLKVGNIRPISRRRAPPPD